MLSKDNQVCWPAETNYDHLPFFKDFNIFRSRLLKSSLPSRDNQVRWHVETNYGHLPFFEDFNVFRTRLLQSHLPSKDNQVCWHVETNMVIFLFSKTSMSFTKTITISFAFQRKSSLLACKDKHGHLPLFEDFNVFQPRLLQSPLPSRDNQVLWHAETNMVICLFSKTSMSFD